MLAGARIFHVNLNCSSLERSREFYVGAIGLGEGVRTTPERPQPGAAFGLERAWWDAVILIGDKGFEGGAIDLLEWREPAPVGAPPARYQRCGFQRVGIAVPDLDAAIARIGAAGARAWSQSLVLERPGGMRLVHADDPDGISLELFERGSGADLAFVSVVCAELERSLSWYGALGFRVLARFPTESPDGSALRIDGPVGLEEVLLAPSGGGSVHLLLAGFRVPAPAPAEERPLNARGIARLALLVSSLDDCLAELDRLRIPRLSDPATLAMGPGLPELRFVCFAGPDGEVLELIEEPRP